MENLKFINPIINSDMSHLNAKLSDSLANLIRLHTKCPKDRLEEYLTKKNVFSYTISMPKDEDFDITLLQKTIEKISNSFDENTFINHILFSDNNTPLPSLAHKMMQEEYNLEGNLEWFTTLFFVNLGELIAAPTFCYRSIKEDIEAGDCIVMSIKENS